MGCEKMPLKILITGGGGFLGRFTARCLREAGNEVTILGRSEYEFAEREGFETIQEDICNLTGLLEAFKGFDEVHHMASKTGISVFYKPFYETNVTGTENVIAACIENDIGKLIYTSSPSVVYKISDQEMIDESQGYPDSWLSHYSRTKAAAEHLVLSANKPGVLLTTSLRPHLIWGPEDTSLIPRLFSRAQKNRLFIVGDSKNKVDVTYVENAARAHLLASRKLKEGSKICGKAYFITNDEPVFLWDFINRLLEGARMKKVKTAIPFRAAYNLGAVLESMYKMFGIKSEPVMTRFLACQLAKSHCYSIQNAKDDLDYRAEISIDEGLERLFKYMSDKKMSFCK